MPKRNVAKKPDRPTLDSAFNLLVKLSKLQKISLEAVLGQLAALAVTRKKKPSNETERFFGGPAPTPTRADREKQEKLMKTHKFQDENEAVIARLQDLGLFPHFKWVGPYPVLLLEVVEGIGSTAIKNASSDLVALRTRWKGPEHDRERDLLENIARHTDTRDPRYEPLGDHVRKLLLNVQENLIAHLTEEKEQNQRLAYSPGLQEAKWLLGIFQNPKKPQHEKTIDEWCKQGLENLRHGPQAFPEGTEQPITYQKLQRRLRLL